MKGKAMNELVKMIACCAVLCISQAHAQTPLRAKIGVLTDLSGTYSDIAGKGAITAARMALDDFAKLHPEIKTELVSADHQNKPDLAMTVARSWVDTENVDVLAELTTSSIALAAQQLGKEKNKIVLISGAGSSDLTGKSCSENSISWVYDTYALANGTGKAVVAQGGKTWHMITVDYAFGHALERDVTRAVVAEGGKVLGTSKHPLNASDLSSQLVTAIGSKAQVIGLANAGRDLVTSVIQAKEFGLAKSNKQLAALLIYISDVHALGLSQSEGLYLTTGFYWDRTDESRQWSRRFFETMKRMPTMAQAGVYSSITHYLKAVHAAKSTDTALVRKKMGEIPVNDMFASKGTVRADGRMVHDLYLAQVKAPADSKYPWDYYKILRTIPGDQAFRSMAEGECPLVSKSVKSAPSR
jgi:branched-chain amino acid transport system substrate-binding protein